MTRECYDKIVLPVSDDKSESYSHRNELDNRQFLYAHRATFRKNKILHIAQHVFTSSIRNLRVFLSGHFSRATGFTTCFAVRKQ